MKNLILLLMLLLAVDSFGQKIVEISGNINAESIRKNLAEIYRLNINEPLHKPIEIVFDSHGGHSGPTIFLISQIGLIKFSGRKFVGTIKGKCHSSCASIFSIMDVRKMVSGSTYMQHLSYRQKVKCGRSCEIDDRYRLGGDASILKTNTVDLINKLKKIKEIKYTAEQMLNKKAIHKIIPRIIRRPYDRNRINNDNR